jgi:murein DD-endopeptidase MepM/ murein hydrolase activator NlpD
VSRYRGRHLRPRPKNMKPAVVVTAVTVSLSSSAPFHAHSLIRAGRLLSANARHYLTSASSWVRTNGFKDLGQLRLANAPHGLPRPLTSFQPVRAVQTPSPAATSGHASGADPARAGDVGLSSGRYSGERSLVSFSDGRPQLLVPGSGIGGVAVTPSPRPSGKDDATQLELSWPIDGPINSPFGPRWGGFHPGIDIGGYEGEPIFAAGRGVVEVAAYNDGYGNETVIDHGRGIETVYGHQSGFAVTAGERVRRGELIGYVGCTGYCTGPHLHFEVRVAGTPMNPMPFLP